MVLAADMAYQESAQARQWIRVDPLPAFVEAGATSGLANITLDADLVVRQMPEGRDVFWREIVRRAAVAMPGVILEPPNLAGAMIRYVGGDHTLPVRLVLPGAGRRQAPSRRTPSATRS